MTEEQSNTLVKMYVEGKSYEDLVEKLRSYQVEDDPQTILKFVDLEHRRERVEMAHRDLRIAILDWSVLFLLLLFRYVGIRVFFDNALIFVSLFLWLPFLRSYWTVQRDKRKFV